MDLVDYIVEVVLENKPAARDPVGQTIQKDLLAGCQHHSRHPEPK